MCGCALFFSLNLNRQSNSIDTPPGTRVFGKIERTRDSGGAWSYLQTAGVVGGKNVTMRVVKDSNTEAFTQAYVVLEHQPLLCAMFPSSNKAVFENIKIKFVDENHSPPVWTAHTKAPACNSTTTILSPSKIQISWSS